jgi:hypothetical protein
LFSFYNFGKVGRFTVEMIAYSSNPSADPDPHYYEKSDPDPHHSISKNRIRLEKCPGIAKAKPCSHALNKQFIALVGGDEYTNENPCQLNENKTTV